MVRKRQNYINLVHDFHDLKLKEQKSKNYKTWDNNEP
jgi:hypothetical protein